jgi:hypothetical protein
MAKSELELVTSEDKWSVSIRGESGGGEPRMFSVTLYRKDGRLVFEGGNHLCDEMKSMLLLRTDKTARDFMRALRDLADEYLRSTE